MLLELKLVTLEDYRQRLCAASLLKKAKISQGLESDRSRGRAQGGNKTRSIKAKGKVLSGSGKGKGSNISQRSAVLGGFQKLRPPSKTSKWTSSAPAGTGGSLGFGNKAESFLATVGSIFSGKVMLKSTISLPLLNGSLCVGIPSPWIILMSACFITWTTENIEIT